MNSRCRTTPASIQLQLRQEANFGCALCGCPVLENAHIIPYRTRQDFVVEDMVALCPTCHTKADHGNYPESYLREIKANPYNKSHVHEAFLIISDELIVNLGSDKFINTPTVLRVDDFDIITIDRLDNKFLNLNVNVFDKLNNWVAVIQDSKWMVDTGLAWDVEYKPQHLTIRNGPRKINLDIKIENGEVFISGLLYYNGFPIKITPTEIWIGEGKIRLMGNIIKDCKVGLDLSTKKQQISYTWTQKPD